MANFQYGLLLDSMEHIYLLGSVIHIHILYICWSWVLSDLGQIAPFPIITVYKAILFNDLFCS